MLATIAAHMQSVVIIIVAIIILMLFEKIFYKVCKPKPPRQ